jgi:hypothetical protein
MRGEFIWIWSSSWGEIWSQLAKAPGAPEDLLCELYRELTLAMRDPPKPPILAERINDPAKARHAFMRTKARAFSGEPAVVAFFERAFSVLEETGDEGELLANRYFGLLTAFVEKFSLRYDLRPPCLLSPTLPGLFSNLLRDLRAVTSQNSHLDRLMRDFEDSVRDLRTDCSEGRIKTCIQKQINLLEALGRACPGVTRNTLGAICEQIGTWPHLTVMEAMKSLYTFASDYPGIRHSGTPENAKRDIDMRDMVAISILLTGFTPYLSDKVNGETVYRGR